MAIVLATLRDKIRVNVGGPTTRELTDATIEASIGDATKAVYAKTGDRLAKLGTITTVAGTQSYVPAATDFGQIINVYWNGQFLAELPTFDSDIPLQEVQLPEGDVNFRSLSLIEDMKRKELREISTYGYRWEFIEGKVYLVPMPETSGLKVKYLYAPKSSDVTQLPDSAEELVEDHATANVARILAMRRLNTGTVDREGLMASSNYRGLLDEAERRDASFAEGIKEFK